VSLKAPLQQPGDFVQQKSKGRNILFHGLPIHKQAYHKLRYVFFKNSKLLLTQLGRPGCVARRTSDNERHFARDRPMAALSPVRWALNWQFANGRFAPEPVIQQLTNFYGFQSAAPNLDGSS
jgi:hypothetical protein